MEEYILENKLKLIYNHTESELTSICISIDAGAGVETEKYGMAHISGGHGWAKCRLGRFDPVVSS